jgi:acetylornithine deacetylase/succinyl-diaminopimelate desuccinylase-like protein
LKFVIEGEEESGSENLEAWLLANREKVKADLVVVSDTNMFDRGVPSLTTGLRGMAYLELEVEGSNTDLHSGGYGGAVANPANVLAWILSSLKDADGKILVPGVYDDVRPLTPREREEFARLPFDEEKFRTSIGAPALTGEKGFSILERLWARPTLDVNGMISGYTGPGAKTVIPAKASAKFSLRLVPDQDPERIGDLVEAYIKRISPPTVRTRVIRHHGGRPSLTPLDHPAVEAAARAVEKASGKRPVFQREGGSIPVVATFQEKLGIPTVMMGFGLPDENAHAPNEWFDLGNYDLGMRSAACLYDELRR